MSKGKVKNWLYYLLTDYKWPLLAALAVIFVAVYSLTAVIGKKASVLNVMLIDCHTDTEPEKMEEDFMDALGYDPRHQEAEFLTSLMFEDAGSGSYTMTSLSRFMTDIGSEKLDVCGMLEEDFIKYDNSQTWLDLSEWIEDGDISVPEEGLLRKGSRVIGIYTSALPRMEAYGCYAGDDASGVVGIVYNTPHREAAEHYLCYLAEA